MKRLYQEIIQQHLAEHEQMLFLAGPRQVGKSTLCLAAAEYTDRFLYLNWDNANHRKVILAGEREILDLVKFHTLSAYKPLVVFDELHKYKNWKNYLKGFYDVYKGKINIIVCGSAKLDIFRRGGDSLMGRYILYRIHPLSVREVIDPSLHLEEIAHPQHVPTDLMTKLLQQGGYPEPFIKDSTRFSNQWRQLRFQQLFREDIQSVERIMNISQLELLAEILCDQAAGTLNYRSLSNDIKVAEDTVKRWINVLSQFYYCFRIQPWHKNVKRSLLKEPKIYLWDWALVHDHGGRIENMVASHLLKAVHLWTDLGLGKFGLYYLRDKDKKEVDFLVAKNNDPWFIVEVKSSANKAISHNLKYFADQLDVTHVFEAVYDLDYVDQDCFANTERTRVPLSTFLSQLV
ncbi:MAG TPA: ATP-binding protein [Gammaproteobacteria bacterium]|nr:ATP-binding protein [Gammaproteobacteria bacterium]